MRHEMHYIGHEVSNMPIFIGNDMLFSASILIIITSVMLLHDTCKEILKSHFNVFPKIAEYQKSLGKFVYSLKNLLSY